MPGAAETSKNHSQKVVSCCFLMLGATAIKKHFQDMFLSLHDARDRKNLACLLARWLASVFGCLCVCLFVLPDCLFACVHVCAHVLIYMLLGSFAGCSPALIVFIVLFNRCFQVPCLCCVFCVCLQCLFIW